MNKTEIEQIFAQALELEETEERLHYLDQACQGNAALRDSIDALFAAHRQAGSFLVEDVDAAATEARRPAEQIGNHIGPYKLLEKIGEGGMGVVYMAEQRLPVERRVALKIIKPGMDSRQVIARFEAERQALAMMNHPNIAKVLDAGVTNSGLPYFVMELVNGIPITQFCDQQHLTAQERLALFIPVCRALQHAHQKGIIHRDIKPSNVLVTLYDSEAVPKVIDFGVAKATQGRLTERTMFTAMGQIVGTVEYMSPEQAQRNQLDIDTRSDVYSLGVLLYELLTGETPLDRRRLRSAAWDEMLRIIREEEPLRPSIRLSSSESLPSIAANRRIEPARLRTLVKGELDWIVMKSLEKDRSRRYESPNAFADDVNRYLHDEPVQACPPSAFYRLGKLLRRNKTAAAVMGVLVVSVVAGLASLLVINRMIAHERDAKDRALGAADRALTEKGEALQAAELAEREQSQLRKLADKQSQAAELAKQRAEENYRTAREAVDRLFTRVAEDLQDQPHMEQVRKQLLEEALQFYMRFLKERSANPELRFETALSQHRVAEIHRLLGNWKDCLNSEQAGDRLIAELVNEFPDNVEYRVQQARGRYLLAESLQRLGDSAAAHPVLEDGLAKWEALLRDKNRPPEYLEEMLRLQLLARDQFFFQYRDWSKYQAFWKESGALANELKSKHPTYSLSRQTIDELSKVSVYDMPKDRTRLRELEELIRDRLATVEAQSSSHPDTPAYQASLSRLLSSLAEVLLACDRVDEMEPLHLRQLAIYEKLVGRFPVDLTYNMELGHIRYEYGLLLYHVGRHSEARTSLEQGIKLIGLGMAREPNVRRHASLLIGALIYCPIAELRDNARALRLADMYGGIGDQILAHINAENYEAALSACLKALDDYPAAKKEGRFFPEATVPLYQMLAAYCRWHLADKEEAKAQFLSAKEGFDRLPSNHYWSAFRYRLRLHELETTMQLSK